jgi:uncharacterized protein YceK
MYRDKKIILAKFPLLIVFLCLFLSGCMSLRQRCGEDFNIEPGPYPGLRITGELIEQSTHDIESAGMIYGMWFYWVPDIPLSFCFDTLCLPYDLAHLTDNSNQQATIPDLQ